MKSIKAKHTFYKFAQVCLITVIVCDFILTGVYFADKQFSLDLGLSKGILIFLWAGAAWVILLLCLMTFTKLFPRQVTTFNQEGLITWEETIRIKRITTTIAYKDILEIEYAKVSVIKIIKGVLAGEISDRVGEMRIKYLEPQPSQENNAAKIIRISPPYSKVKAAAKAFNLDIKLVEDKFSF